MPAAAVEAGASDVRVVGEVARGVGEGGAGGPRDCVEAGEATAAVGYLMLNS